MAKLTGPLFSLKASGKIAKTLVYLPWKGLNNVRQYVIPTNPNTPAQIAQRITNFKAGVTKWHSFTLSDADKAAWIMLASTCYSKVHAYMKGAMSGFNAFMRYFIDALIADAATVWNEISSVTCVAGAGPILTITVGECEDDDTLELCYGLSKDYMPYTDAPEAGHADDANIFITPALLPSTKYYYYVHATAANRDARTGIYSATTLAA